MANRPLLGALAAAGVCAWFAAAGAAAAPRVVKAQVPAGITPPWTKGIVPITPEGYYNAIACGKQGGQNPPCVFWDTGICKNEDFDLAFYTGYKAVAYEVWQAVRAKQPAPKPDYAQAQRTRVTIGVTTVRGSKNEITDFVLKRGAKSIPYVDRNSTSNGKRFTFDYPAFAPGSALTMDLVGTTRTVSCRAEPAVLARFR
jgi:hypothetical protein